MDFMECLEQFRDEIEGDFILPLEAQRFLAIMREEKPALLKEWLNTHAIEFVTEKLRTLDRQDRSKALHRAGPRAFAASADQPAEERASLFRVTFVVDENYTRRHLGDMTGKDLRFVAESYETRAKRGLAIAAYMKALAKKAGDGKLSEVMDEEAAERLLETVTGKKTPALA